MSKAIDPQTGHREPLRLSGALDAFDSFDVTPVIGHEFVNVDVAAWLRAPNSDDLIRDLAITVARRGVVFFRAQNNMTNDLQKELVQRMGELSGKPATSRLHIHPVHNSAAQGVQDDEISLISSKQAQRLYKDRPRPSGRIQWHSDITFEPVPSDYSLLRMTQLPKTGGDTLWASGYELYERISPSLRNYLSTLTAHCANPYFAQAAAANNLEMFPGPRGSPENVGVILEAMHPVIRTNPVTGWNSVFSVGHHVASINGLTKDESDYFLKRFIDLIVENHDLHVRLRWQNENDMAIWDNRCTYHAATPDHEYEPVWLGDRAGSRAVSVGEKPYFDAKAVSRRQGIEKELVASVASA